MKKVACISYLPSYIILDHIIPLAYLLNLPVYIENLNLNESVEKFYPQAKNLVKPSISYKSLANKFDALISCDTWFLEDKIAFKNFNKDMLLIFCPHGNSDKGYIMDAKMQAYAMQDMVLLYGNHMIDLLKNLNVFDKLKKYAVVGNYRLSFYKKFKKFYDDLIEKLVFSKLNKNNITILYAPTWKDQENSSSFFDAYEKLIKSTPKNINLIIKPHPNLEFKHPVEYYKIYQEKLPKNIFLLENCPIIYPLLNRCDIYLGDFSSIGYDFLYFQRPMFFLDPNQREKNSKSLFLHKCGTSIDKENWDDIFLVIQKTKNDFKDIQKEIYKYTFGDELKISEIKKLVFENLN